MKRRGLILTTFVTVLVASVVFARPGTPDSNRSQPRTTAAIAPATGNAQEAVFSEAALRWRTGQPTHWRALLLQR